jgi:hypothetical protein
MRGALFVAMVSIAACAGPAAPARSQPTQPPEETRANAPAAAGHQQQPGAGEPEPPGTEAGCKAAWERFHAAVEAATTGCSSDDDCEEFQSCDAVTRPNAARLWKLRGEAQVTCRGLGTTAEITCGNSGPPRCKQGRCGR